MNTPTHILVGLAICARRDERRSGPAAGFGALAPDLSLYLLAGTSLIILQIPPERVFGALYFSPAWQTIFAIDNSFILWGAGFLAALAFGARAAMALTGAALLHIAMDFPVHHDDARPHFWPLSDWVFESPLSYWDSAHNAGLVAPIGVLAALISAVVIWRRWPNWPLRAGVLIACLLELWVVRQWILFF